jgi:predicted acetyltransferase
MPLEQRLVAGDPAAIDAWIRAIHTGFLDPVPPTDEQLELRRAKQDYSRARGVFDGDRCVATFRSFDQRLTVPGGGDLAANAVSAVTVLATHRRRGLLSGMMREDLALAKERGDAVATLIAAEYLIYGRYGFGPATHAARWRVTAKTRTGLDPSWRLPDAEGTLSFVDGAEVRKEGPGLHERFRATRAGAVSRNAFYWERATGETQVDTTPWKEPFWVLFRDADGVPQGLVSFDVTDNWDGAVPADVAKVRGYLAVTPAAERALWRFLLSVDWVHGLEVPDADPDALLPDVLPDARAAKLAELADFLWLRPLDVPATLTGRTYPAAGDLVLDVRDPLGLAEGRYLLAATPEGARCERTTRSADLTLDTGALARLYLGNETASRLVAAGVVDEHTSGASAGAEVLFHTGRRPWCPDVF